MKKRVTAQIESPLPVLVALSRHSYNRERNDGVRNRRGGEGNIEAVLKENAE